MLLLYTVTTIQRLGYIGQELICNTLMPSKQKQKQTNKQQQNKQKRRLHFCGSNQETQLSQ